MQLVHRALQSGSPDASSVSVVARRHGFRDLGRFAANYRAFLGELPSATLKRGSRRGGTALTLGRPRVKVS
jgi:AraC-like DNA-binding protein